MTYPIGTLLAGEDRYFVVVTDKKGPFARDVSGRWQGSGMPIRPWMTPVPCPSNVAESPTVPDWASDTPLGGMALDKPA